MKLMHLCVV
jgi:hypothetical protein